MSSKVLAFGNAGQPVELEAQTDREHYIDVDSSTGVDAKIAAAIAAEVIARNAAIAAAIATEVTNRNAAITAALANIFSELWTPAPSVFSGTSVSSVTSPGQWTITRVGNVATLGGQLSVTVGSAGQSVIHVDALPFHNGDFIGYPSTMTSDATKASFVPGSIHNNTLSIVVNALAAGVCSCFVLAQYNIS